MTTNTVPVSTPTGEILPFESFMNNQSQSALLIKALLYEVVAIPLLTLALGQTIDAGTINHNSALIQATESGANPAGIWLINKIGEVISGPRVI